MTFIAAISLIKFKQHDKNEVHERTKGLDCSLVYAEDEKQENILILLFYYRIIRKGVNPQWSLNPFSAFCKYLCPETIQIAFKFALVFMEITV